MTIKRLFPAIALAALITSSIECGVHVSVGFNSCRPVVYRPYRVQRVVHVVRPAIIVEEQPVIIRKQRRCCQPKMQFCFHMGSQFFC